MEDISLHILDIAENSVRAGARQIDLEITVDTASDRLSLLIADDGSGMNPGQLSRATDPFFTSKSGKKTGMGLPLLDEAARLSEGSMKVESSPGAGTRVRATFRLSHIDRKPMGRIADTMVALIAGYPDADFTLTVVGDGIRFNFSTREIKKKFKDLKINSPAVLSFIRRLVDENTEELKRI